MLWLLDTGALLRGDTLAYLSRYLAEFWCVAARPSSGRGRTGTEPRADSGSPFGDPVPAALSATPFRQPFRRPRSGSL